VTEVFIEHRMLEAFGMQVAGKCASQASVGSVRILLVSGVNADVANQQVEQTIVVVVEKERAGGMGQKIKAGFVSYVFEVAVAVVLKKNISFVNSGDVKILVPAIVDVAERGGDADAIFHTDAGLLGDIFEFPIAEITPQFVAAKLADEVNVVKSVPIYIGDGDAGAMVVVDGHVIAGGVERGVFTKSDAAFLELIGEMKLVKHLELTYRIELRLFASRQGSQAGVILGEGHDGRGGFLGRQRGAERGGKY